MVRIAEGMGYWLQPGAVARQLTTGDGLIAARNVNGVVRTSQLGPLKLQFFTIHPQHLHGLLTVTEGHQLEAPPNNSSSCISIFTASEPVGQNSRAWPTSRKVKACPCVAPCCNCGRIA